MRLRILEAARELFDAGGEAAVTLRGVAERVEYAPATIYLYFQDKAALLRELCAGERLTLERVLRQAERVADPRERLRATTLAYVDFGLGRPALYRAMFLSPPAPVESLTTAVGSAAVPTDATGRGASPADPGLAPAPPSPNGDPYPVFYNVALKAVAAGCFRPEHRDAHEIAQALWSAAHGVVALSLAQTPPVAGKPGSTPRHSARETAQFLVDSLLTGWT